MTEIFGTKFYFSGAGWFGYGIYLLLALIVIRVMYRLLLRRIPGKSLRRVTILVLSAAVLTWPLWEVVAIGLEAKKVCAEQGGLRVYKIVEVGGIRSSSIKYWSEYGFSYVESGNSQRKNRWEIINGNIVRKSINEFSTQYGVQTGMNSKKINKNFSRTDTRVVNLNNEVILGELTTISIYPSWFDIRMIRLMGGGSTAWQCGNEAPEGKGSYQPGTRRYIYGSSDVVKATLKPSK